MQAYEHQALVRGKWRTIITIMVGRKCIIVVTIILNVHVRRRHTALGV